MKLVSIEHHWHRRRFCHASRFLKRKCAGLGCKFLTWVAVPAALVLGACGTGGESGDAASGAADGSSSGGSSIPEPAKAYFVSPVGSDSNDGLSIASPFQTLERAQSAMRTSSIKTTNLLGGVYQRTSILRLTALDAGEMWQAYPGDTPILDGGYVVSEAIYASDISGLSVQGLTVRNFLRIGIHIQNSSDVVIERNTVINIHSDGWNQAGVFLQNNIGNTKVTRNLIRDVNYCGILYANSKGETVKNLSIERNAIYSTCGAVADCGAIHADDRSHTASGIVIDNNIVGNYGSVATKARGVFLDDLLSNAVVSNNIIYGKGQYAFLIHGGDHNTIVNNIFDISGAENLAQYVGTPSLGPSYGMAGNTVTCNIVYSSALPPKVLWLQTLQSGDQLPTVTDNLYWGDVGVLPNSGQIVDTKPTVTNPRFVAPSQANYQFSSGVPAFCSSFKAIDTSQVGP